MKRLFAFLIALLCVLGAGSALAQTRVVAPLTGTVTAGTWVNNQRLTVAAMPNGFMEYAYLLPQGYDPTSNVVYPLLILEHWNTAGMNGNTYPADTSSNLGEWQCCNTPNFRRAFPAIILVPLADQSVDTSGANGNANFGGYLDTPNSGGNEQGVLALIAHAKATWKVDATRVYCTGDSLGGIGCLALLADNNSQNGSNKVVTAAMSFSDNMNRTGNDATIARMKTVPFLAASTPFDNRPDIYDQPAWLAYTGNTSYPTPSTYDSSGIAGIRAGTSNFYYVARSDGVMPWEAYRLLNADGGDGTNMYTWLFSQISGSVAESISIGANFSNVGQPFIVSGGISNVSTAPTLQYQTDGGGWLSLPGGSSVSATAYSFTSPGLAAGNHTIMVRDAGNPSISASSTFLVAGTETASGTTVTTVGPVITDALGHSWTLSGGGGINKDGASIAGPPGSGGLIVTQTSGNSITDGSGDVWTLGVGGVFRNGVAVPNGAGTSQIVYSGLILYFQDSTTGVWYNYDGTSGNFNPTSAPSLASSITELAYVNHVVWALTSSSAWYSRTAAGGWNGPSANPLTTTVTLAVSAIGAQAHTSGFTVTGTISGASSAPTLQYQDNNGAWVNLPVGTATGTRKWWENPGGNGSPWVTPIGSGAQWSGANDADTKDLCPQAPSPCYGNINSTDFYGHTMWIGTSSDGLYKINMPLNGRTKAPDNGSTAAWSVRVPTGAYAGGPYPGDNSMTFMDRAQNRMYGTGLNLALPGFQPGGGPYTGTLGEWDDPTSDLFGNDADNGNSGYIVGIGIINYCDVNPSCNPTYPRIQHAWRWVTDRAYMKSNAIAAPGQELKPNSWPQRLEDYQPLYAYTGNILAGSTLGIPITAVMPGGLDSNCQGMWWTMQHYPGYFRDVAGGGFNLSVDQISDTSAYVASIRGCLPTLVSYLRVMRNQHQTGQSYTANPANGPGTRLDVGPPKLLGTGSTSGGATVTTTTFSFPHPAMATAASNVIRVRDASQTSVVATSNTFLVASGVEALGIVPLTSVVAGAPFQVVGTVAGVTTAPVLQYQDGSGAWQPFPSGSGVTNTTFSFQHPALAAGTGNVINVRDANQTAVTATSNTFAATAVVERLTVNTIGTQLAGGFSFTVAGTIANDNVPPVLEYQDNGGAWVPFPGGSPITLTTYSFAHPAMSAGTGNVVSIRNPANPGGAANSNSFMVTGAVCVP